MGGGFGPELLGEGVAVGLLDEFVGLFCAEGGVGGFICLVFGEEGGCRVTPAC